MDWQPEHWLLMLGFVTAHAVPAYLMFWHYEKQEARRTSIRPHIATILGRNLPLGG